MPHKHCSYPCTANGTRTQQSGVVLIVALALLVVIGFSSAFILRNALFSDTSSNNLNTNQAANHAAEVALRHCEDMVLNPPAGGLKIIPLPDTGSPIAWRKESNWTAGNDGVFTAPADLLQSTASNGKTLTYTQLPQCMIEQLQLIPDSSDRYKGKPFAFQITARGYSPDGISQVVLQSTIRTRSCNPGIPNMDC